MADFTRNLAFFIGINNYSNGIPHLQTAVNDAKDLVKILREKHGYQVWVCLDETASLNNLNNLLTNTLPQQVQANDRLLFYFAGHGVALNGNDGPEGYLIPQDAKLGDVQSYLQMTKLQEALLQLPCRHFLGILDCCFAGAFRWSANRDLLATPEVIHKERYDRLICDPAWQVITSSGYDQKAADAFVLRSRDQEGDHSPFAAALLDAFAGGADTNPAASDDKPAGDGITTATELYLFLRDRVESATQGNSQRQTPGIWPLKKHDKGEYIFLTPGHEINLPPAPPLDASKNPYRGLESFEEKDSQFFFGRDSLEDKLLDVVINNTLTLVLGASGSGKSSLVKAGLIPKIRKLTSEKWYILPPIRPGDMPFRSLNFALVNSHFPQVDQLAPKTLSDRITEWISRNQDTKLLLVIDQSEELITLCHHEEERERFFSELATAIATHSQQLRVVLTIRSDFEPQLRDSILQSLPEALQIRNTLIKNRWQAARFLVPAMSRLQLRDAIEKPAELRVMHFKPHTLVDQLIDEVADMPGALPLLSFALSELYLKYLKRQQTASNNGDSIDRAITQEDYDQMGGVTQSLTQRSDREYDELVSKNPAYKQIIRHVMLRMVAVGGGELARRQLPLSELKYDSSKQELVDEVLEQFSQARLLVQGQDAEGNTYVELAHGVLVRGWLKLRNWLQEEKNLRLQRRLTPAAMEWNSHKKTEFLWHGDPYLNVLYKDVLNSVDNNWLNQVENEFVQRSWQRKINIIRSRWGIAFTVILGSIGLAGWAITSQRSSQFGEINSKIISSEALFNSNQDLDALLNSLQAGKKFQQRLFSHFQSDDVTRNAVVQNLRKTFYAVKESNRSEVQAEWGSFQSIFFDKDNQLRFATAQSNGIVSLRDFWGRELTKLPGHKGFAKFIATQDGSLFATNDDGTGNGTGTIHLWSPNKKIREFIADEKGLEIIRFSDDGQIIATLSEDENKNNVARLWNLQGDKLSEFPLPNAIKDLVFHPREQMMIAIDKDEHLQFFDLLGNYLEVPAEFKKIDKIQRIKFGPNGMIVTKSASIATLWRFDSEKVEKFMEIKLPEGEIQKMAFSRDSKQLAIYSNDGILHLWNLEPQPLSVTQFSPKQLRSLSFSQNDQIVGVTKSGIVRLFDLGGNQLKEFPIEPNHVTGGSFSPNGQQIATINYGGIVGLLNLQGQLKEFQAHPTEVSSVKFSPDGQKIATIGDNDKKRIIVRLWNSKGQKLQEFALIYQHQVRNTYFQPDGKLKVVTIDTKSKALFLWDFLGANGMRILKPEDSAFEAIAFSQDDKFATATDNTIKLWDLHGRELLKFRGHESKIASLSFSRDGSILAVIGEDGTAKLWHFAELEQLLSQGCDRLNNYLQNTPALNDEIRQTCQN